MLRLRALREKRGYTGVQLAQRAGISRPNLSLYERGRGNPTLATLKQLAAALEVEVRDLFVPPLDAESDRGSRPDRGRVGADDSAARQMVQAILESPRGAAFIEALTRIMAEIERRKPSDPDGQ